MVTSLWKWSGNLSPWRVCLLVLTLALASVARDYPQASQKAIRRTCPCGAGILVGEIEGEWTDSANTIGSVLEREKKREGKGNKAGRGVGRGGWERRVRWGSNASPEGAWPPRRTRGPFQLFPGTHFWNWNPGDSKKKYKQPVNIWKAKVLLIFKEWKLENQDCNFFSSYLTEVQGSL